VKGSLAQSREGSTCPFCLRHAERLLGLLQYCPIARPGDGSHRCLFAVLQLFKDKTLKRDRSCGRHPTRRVPTP
jgi:hypothetical protein